LQRSRRPCTDQKIIRFLIVTEKICRSRWPYDGQIPLKTRSLMLKNAAPPRRPLFDSNTDYCIFKNFIFRLFRLFFAFRTFQKIIKWQRYSIGIILLTSCTNFWPSVMYWLVLYNRFNRAENTIHLDYFNFFIVFCLKFNIIMPTFQLEL
jgi:hypothetical protein